MKDYVADVNYDCDLLYLLTYRTSWQQGFTSSSVALNIIIYSKTSEKLFKWFFQIPRYKVYMVYHPSLSLASRPWVSLKRSKAPCQSSRELCDCEWGCVCVCVFTYPSSSTMISPDLTVGSENKGILPLSLPCLGSLWAHGYTQAFSCLDGNMEQNRSSDSTLM